MEIINMVNGKKKEMTEIIKEVGELPAMPIVAVKVMELVASPDTTANDLKRVIAADPVLTAKILRFSNSALYSCVREVSTLTDAIVIMGFNTIRSLVIATSTRSLYLKAGKEAGTKEKLLWKHSVACAISSRITAERVKYPPIEEAFIGGLLHDIGKVVLLQKESFNYSQIFKDAQEGKKNFAESEYNTYGFTHASLGALVIKEWNLPQELEMAILVHHNEKFDGKEILGAIINFSDLICQKLGIGPISDESLSIQDSNSTKMLGIDQKVIDEIQEGLKKAVIEEEELFSL
ncbi:MAG: HDOD domain-containing protein [bacterium]